MFTHLRLTGVRFFGGCLWLDLMSQCRVMCEPLEEAVKESRVVLCSRYKAKLYAGDSG